MADTNKQIPCEKRSCKSRSVERPHHHKDDDVQAEIRSRPVLYTGVLWIGILRRFLIPRTCPPTSTVSSSYSETHIDVDTNKAETQSVSHVTTTKPSKMANISATVTKPPRSADISTIVVKPPKTAIISPTVSEPPRSADISTIVVKPPKSADISTILVNPQKTAKISTTVTKTPRTANISPTVSEPPRLADISTTVVKPPRSATISSTVASSNDEIWKKSNEPASLISAMSEPKTENDSELWSPETIKNFPPLSGLKSHMQDLSNAVAEQAQRLSENISRLVREGQESTSETIDRLRSQEAVAGRIGAITISGLLGYMVGLQHSPLVRLVYSLTGGVAMATVCYPKQAVTYNDQGLSTMRQGMVYSIELIKDELRKIPHTPLFDDSDLDEKNSTQAPDPSNSKTQINFKGSSNLPERAPGDRGHGYNQTNNKRHDSFSDDTGQDLEELNKNVSFQQNKVPFTNSSADSKSGEKEHNYVDSKIQIYDERFPYSSALASPSAVRTSSRKPSTVNANSLKSTFVENISSDVKTYPFAKYELQPPTGENISGPEKGQDLNNYQFLPSDSTVDEESWEQRKEELNNEDLTQPLNKKLGRFYLSPSKDTVAFPSEGYDDLYSNRK